jgi:hypothetical protein
LQNGERLALGMQQISGPPEVKTFWPDQNLLGFCNSRQVQMFPAALVEQVPDEIIHMQTLHHDDD